MVVQILTQSNAGLESSIIQLPGTRFNTRTFDKFKGMPDGVIEVVLAPSGIISKGPILPTRTS